MLDGVREVRNLMCGLARAAVSAAQKLSPGPSPTEKIAWHELRLRENCSCDQHSYIELAISSLVYFRSFIDSLISACSLAVSVRQVAPLT